MFPHLAGQEYPDAKNPSACQKQSAGFKAQMTHVFLFLISVFHSLLLPVLQNKITSLQQPSEQICKTLQLTLTSEGKTVTNLLAFSSQTGSSSGSAELAFKNVAFELVLFCDKAGPQDIGEVTTAEAVMSQCRGGCGMDMGSVKGYIYWTVLSQRGLGFIFGQEMRPTRKE